MDVCPKCRRTSLGGVAKNGAFYTVRCSICGFTDKVKTLTIQPSRGSAFRGPSMLTPMSPLPQGK